MKSILAYLHLNKIGALEMLFAFYMILSGYTYGPIRGTLIFLLLMVFISFFYKESTKQNMQELFWLACFVLIHELILTFQIIVPDYMLNNLFTTILVCICIYPIAKKMNYERMLGSLNWVAILSMAGIVYHFILVQRGQEISPIQLPFMPSMDSSSRLYELSTRPRSFYWEPAAFSTFMMIPLFVALFEKKYIWAAIITVSMFLSTSSTGILMSLVMIIVTIFIQDVRIRYKIWLAVVGVFLIWFLLNSSLFEAGVTKIVETDEDNTIRLVNGPALVFNMPLQDLVTGMKAANVYDYWKAGGFHSINIIERRGFIFVPTFWLVLAKYGIIGLLLFLYLYISFLKKRELIPYIVVLFISMFFQSLMVGGAGFAFQLIFLYVFRRNLEKNRVKSDALNII